MIVNEYQSSEVEPTVTLVVHRAATLDDTYVRVGNVREMETNQAYAVCETGRDVVEVWALADAIDGTGDITFADQAAMETARGDHYWTLKTGECLEFPENDRYIYVRMLSTDEDAFISETRADVSTAQSKSEAAEVCQEN